MTGGNAPPKGRGRHRFNANSLDYAKIIKNYLAAKAIICVFAAELFRG